MNCDTDRITQKTFEWSQSSLQGPVRFDDNYGSMCRVFFFLKALLCYNKCPLNRRKRKFYKDDTLNEQTWNTK